MEPIFKNIKMVEDGEGVRQSPKHNERLKGGHRRAHGFIDEKVIILKLSTLIVSKRLRNSCV